MGERGEVIPAGPLWTRVRSRGDKAAFCKALGISAQVLNNWRERGVPARRLTEVCNQLRITRDRYRQEAGLPPEVMPVQRGLASPALLSDFEALPPAFQDHIARVAAELRGMWDSVPEKLRPLVSAPPMDPERYAEWEQSIKALIAGIARRR